VLTCLFKLKNVNSVLKKSYKLIKKMIVKIKINECFVIQWGHHVMFR